MRLFFFLLFITIQAAAQDADKVRLVHQWNDTGEVRINRIGQRYSDVWGFVQGGREYAVIGSTEGAHIIDVQTGKQVAFGAGTARGTEIIHRDYKTYKNYLYAVCDEGISSLQIYDLKYLPDSLHQVYSSDPMELTLCHNIFIDTAKAKLYTASVKGILSGSDHMRVYSLQNPEQPELLTRYNMNAKVHDVYVRNDTAYCSSEFYGYEVVDFRATDGTWQNIGVLTNYPYKGYNHSSWINDKGIGVMADETHGMPIKVIDVNNLEDIRVLGYFAPRYDSTCIPHNPYLIGNYAFVSWYFDGFQIYDISNPASPVRAGYYDTYPEASFVGFAGAWGCYPFLPSGKVLVSDMQTGLYVFDVTEAVPDFRKPADVQVFPNPATDYVNLRFPEDWIGLLQVRVTDLSGRTVLLHPDEDIAGQGNRAIRLPLPAHWTPGLYFLTATAGNKAFHTKILKH